MGKILLVIMGVLSVGLMAQTEKSITAVALFESPHLDGRLDEAVYAQAKPAGDFVQFHPRNSAPASLATEFYVFFTRRHLYLALRCHDPQPKQIKADVTPFGAFNNNDEIEVMLDPFLDRQNSIAFTVNAAGVRGGAETIWRAASHIDTQGWSVEIEIPFTSLRFPRQEIQAWGIGVRRRIFRLNETDYWNVVTREQEVVLPSTFGTLQGLTNIMGGKYLELFPYLGVRDSRAPGEKESRFAYGLDLKYGITSNLTLDLTTSPDYSDVESDPFFYQLDPYEVSLAEKRPFYNEGSSFFSTGFTLFHSRRVTHPDFATKITGQEGGFSIGAIAVHDQDDKSGDHWHNVVRLKRNLFKLSWAGLIFSSLESSAGWNRNTGIDFSFRFPKNTTLSGMAAWCLNEDGPRNQVGLYRLVFSRKRESGLSLSTIFMRFEPGVKVPNGFINSVDYQYLWFLPRYTWRWEGRVLESLSFTLSSKVDQTISSREWKSYGTEAILTANFANQFSVYASYGLYSERYMVSNEQGQMQWNGEMTPTQGVFLSADYNGSAHFKTGFSMSALRSGVYTADFSSVLPGRQEDWQLWADLQPSPRWRLEFFYSRSRRLSDDGSVDFTGNLLSSTLRYQFTPALSAWSKWQYDSMDQRFGVDLSLLYEPAPVSRIVLSIKTLSEEQLRLFRPDTRTITLKVSYLFRI